MTTEPEQPETPQPEPEQPADPPVEEAPAESEGEPDSGTGSTGDINSDVAAGRVTVASEPQGEQSES